jgi:CDP-glucose 4,6-dehydratase
VENLELILEEFRGKKVFVTGHSGFKGSWLSSILDKYGVITKGYSLKPNTNPALYNNIEFSNNHLSVYSDIRDYDKFKKEILSFEPDFIFHMAAQPLVLESYKNPRDTYEINFLGTLNLLEILKESNLTCTCILITTDKVYKNLELNRAFVETDSLGGNDPYSASKASCEILIDSYYTSFFQDSDINIASARAGNVIGGGDWSANRLFPDIIRSIYGSEDFEIRNPSATRPWQHVLEPLAGYLLLALKLQENPEKYNGAWNFGPINEDNESVKGIIDKINKAGLKLSLSINRNKKFKEAKFLSLDINKAINNLNWEPKWDTEKSIKKTINWYQKFYNGENVNNLIYDDLISYVTDGK